MIEKKNTPTRPLVLLAILVALVAVGWLLSCASQTDAHETEPSTTPDWQILAMVSKAQEPEVAEIAPVQVMPRERAPEVADPDTALNEYMDLCEDPMRVIQIDQKTGESIIPPKRKITIAEQNRTKDLIRVVAKEMGADPDMFLIWALRESSYRWFKRHQLNPDMEAARTAWKKHRPSETRERELTEMLEAKPDWSAKAELDRITIYRDNPTYAAAWRWSTGYGLYGMQPVYHVKRWDPNAAPELLCDPVVATIVAIWAARAGKSICSSTGHGDSYQVVNRIFSTGHCTPGVHEDRFAIRAQRRGLDYLETAQLGSKWPQATTDRAEVLAHMNAKIAERRGDGPRIVGSLD